MKKMLKRWTIILAAMAFAAGCEDDDHNHDHDSMEDGTMADTTAETDTSETTTDATTDEMEEVGDTTPPVISNLAMTENPNNVLSGLLEFDTDEMAAVAIDVTGPNGVVFSIAGDMATSHSFPVVGLHAETEYSFDITATDAAGNAAEDAISSFTTSALPSDIPEISATGTASGPIMFSYFKWAPALNNESGIVIVDEAGEVIWYHLGSGDVSVNDVRMLASGNILYIEGDEVLYEIDQLGNNVKTWHPEDISAESIHHEVYPMPNGNWVALTSVLHKDTAGYTDGDGNPVSYDVVSDGIVEFNPETNEVVKSYDTFDILDPMRQVLPSFNGGYWNNYYAEQSEGTKDWTHGNAVIYDENDDSYILSLRHQDWLVKIAREDGALIWTLGPDSTFTMTGDGVFQHHQHAPMLTGADTILLFDNGNFRDTPPYSRGVEYRLDTSDADKANWTVEQIWEFRAPDADVFAPFVSDANRLDNGNTLVHFGGAVVDPAIPFIQPENQKVVRTYEVTASGDVAFELEIVPSDTTTPLGVSSYRAVMLPEGWRQ